MTREEAIKYLIRPVSSSTIDGEEKSKEFEAYKMAIEALEQQKTGYWLNLELIPNDITGHTYGECSVCGKLRIVDNFCPNCGSRNVFKDEVEE